MKKAFLLGLSVLMILLLSLQAGASTQAVAQTLDKKEHSKKTRLPFSDSENTSLYHSKNSTSVELKDVPSEPIIPVFTQGLIPNALKPLVTPTYENSGQAVHPSVIDFKTEYNLDSWRGYRYWMAMTPYPDGYERFENPSLLASKDGINWLTPDGLSKPIDILNGQGHFNSDPTLVYDPDEKALLVYWRETSKGEYDQIWRMKYLSSGKWESKIPVLKENWVKPKTTLLLSPSVWRKSAKEWYLWTASGTGTIQFNLYDSTDGIKWGNRRETEAPWKDWNGGFLPWHLEVKPNLPKGKVDILISGWQKGLKLSDMILVLAESPISDLTKVTMPFDKPLVVNGLANQWDDDFIYKSSFVREDKNGQSLYHIWYSARSTTGKWHIGYTSGALGDRE